jgi:MoxR-like ATPase
MLFATTGVEDRVLKTILSADELMMAQRLVRQLPVGDQVVDAILKLGPLGSAWHRHRPGARRHDCLGPGSLARVRR